MWLIWPLFSPQIASWFRSSSTTLGDHAGSTERRANTSSLAKMMPILCAKHWLMLIPCKQPWCIWSSRQPVRRKVWQLSRTSRRKSHVEIQRLFEDTVEDVQDTHVDMSSWTSNGIYTSYLMMRTSTGCFNWISWLWAIEFEAILALKSESHQHRLRFSCWLLLISNFKSQKKIGCILLSGSRAFFASDCLIGSSCLLRSRNYFFVRDPNCFAPPCRSPRWKLGKALWLRVSRVRGREHWRIWANIHEERMVVKAIWKADVSEFLGF